MRAALPALCALPFARCKRYLRKPFALRETLPRSPAATIMPSRLRGAATLDDGEIRRSQSLVDSGLGAVSQLATARKRAQDAHDAVV